MSKLKLTTLANQDDSASVPADTIVSGTAKAWVNFNGTGTVAIRRAFNVSSVTDNGTGDYTVNFTTAMPDANYAFQISAFNTTDGGTRNVLTSSTAPTSSALRFQIANTNATKADCNFVCASIFR